MTSFSIRRARTSDVRTVRGIIDSYGDDRILLSKPTVTLYEDVQEFFVAEAGGDVVGCGALHVMWEDLAEVRTLAVDPDWQRRGIGSALLTRLLDTARELGVRRVFTLTFQIAFFSSHGFQVLESEPVGQEVYEQLLQSYDAGVAEFLDLDRVKPNTLGNTRMIRRL